MWKGKETYQRKLLLFCARITHSIPSSYTHLLTMMALRDEIFAFYTWTIFPFFSTAPTIWMLCMWKCVILSCVPCGLSFILRWYVMPLVSHVIQHFLWRSHFYISFLLPFNDFVVFFVATLYSKWKALDEEMFVFNISILVSFSSSFCDSFCVE